MSKTNEYKREKAYRKGIGSLFSICLSFITLLLLFGVSLYQEIFTKQKYRFKKNVSKRWGDKHGRKHPRQIVGVPVMLADWNLKNCSDGTLRNLSSGGINLELENALPEGANIFFQIAGAIEMATAELEKDEIVPAEVIWCMESRNQLTNNYSVGMKFITELN